PGWVERTIRCGDRAGGRLCQRTAPPGRRPFPDAACGLIRATALPPSGCRENAVERGAVVDPVRTSWYQGGAGARCVATRCGISSRLGGRGLPRMRPCPGYASVPVRPGTPGPRGRFYELRITNYELRITNHESRITNHQSPITPTQNGDPRGRRLRWRIGSGGRI